MNPVNLGKIVLISGSIVDIRFDADLPPVNALLRTGSENQIMIEVVEQLDSKHLRGIALPPRTGIFHGMAVEDRGARFCHAQLSVPPSDGLKARAGYSPPGTTQDSREIPEYR